MKWEFDLISLRDKTREGIKDIFDAYGNGMWELVSVDNGVAYFKRPDKELEMIWQEAIKNANLSMSVIIPVGKK
jgi:hypothetical protein